MTLWLFWRWLFAFWRFIAHGGQPKKIHSGLAPGKQGNCYDACKQPVNTDNCGENKNTAKPYHVSGEKKRASALSSKLGLLESIGNRKEHQENVYIVDKIEDKHQNQGLFCEDRIDVSLIDVRTRSKVQNNGYLISQRLHDTKKERNQNRKSKSPSPQKSNESKKKSKVFKDLLAGTDSSVSKDSPDRLNVRTSVDSTCSLNGNTDNGQKSDAVILDGNIVKKHFTSSETSEHVLSKHYASVTSRHRLVPSSLQISPVVHSSNCDRNTCEGQNQSHAYRVKHESQATHVTATLDDYATVCAKQTKKSVRKLHDNASRSKCLSSEAEVTAVQQGEELNKGCRDNGAVGGNEDVIRSIEVHIHSENHDNGDDFVDLTSGEVEEFCIEDTLENLNNQHEYDNELNENLEDMAYRRSSSADSSAERGTFTRSVERIQVYERYMEKQTKEMLSEMSRRRKSMDSSSCVSSSSPHIASGAQRNEPGTVFITRTSPKRTVTPEWLRERSNVSRTRRRTLSGGQDVTLHEDSYARYSPASRHNVSEDRIRSKIRNHMSSIIGRQLFSSDEDVLYTYNLHRPLKTAEDWETNSVSEARSAKSDETDELSENQNSFLQVPSSENYQADSEPESSACSLVGGLDDLPYLSSGMDASAENGHKEMQLETAVSKEQLEYYEPNSSCTEMGSTVRQVLQTSEYRVSEMIDSDRGVVDNKELGVSSESFEKRMVKNRSVSTESDVKTRNIDVDIVVDTTDQFDLNIAEPSVECTDKQAASQGVEEGMCVEKAEDLTTKVVATSESSVRNPEEMAYDGNFLECTEKVEELDSVSEIIQNEVRENTVSVCEESLKELNEILESTENVDAYKTADTVSLPELDEASLLGLFDFSFVRVGERALTPDGGGSKAPPQHTPSPSDVGSRKQVRHFWVSVLVLNTYRKLCFGGNQWFCICFHKQNIPC